MFCIGAFPLSKPLPLGEVSPKVTERARPLTEKLLYSDTLTLTKRQLIAAQNSAMPGLPSQALTRQLYQRESLLAEGRQKTAYKGYTFLSIIIERVFPHEP